MNSKKQKEHCTRLLREHELGRGEWQGGSQGKLLTTLPYALTYCTYHKKDNNIISLMSGSGCSTALLVGLWAAQAVGSECARGCGCDSSKSFTFTFFYALLCFGIAAGGRHRRTCVYVRQCSLYMYIHMYMRIWIRRRGPPAVRCALSLALLSFV